MPDKKRDCQYCGGSGRIVKNLIDMAPCEYCKGTGEVAVGEKRKSILVSVPTHVRMGDMARKRKMTFVHYVTYLIERDHIIYHFEKENQ